MKLLPLNKLGAHEKANKTVRFGFLLPWVSALQGNRLFVKIIKEEDQFLQDIAPHRFELSQSELPVYGEYWQGEIRIKSSDRKSANSKWGEPGQYVYRYELESPLLPSPLDWVVDPYAREFGIGRQSAFTLGYEDFEWGSIEEEWKTPQLKDIIAYEIMLHEFAFDLERAKDKIPYLQDLGINCIEVMPVSNVDRSIDWGFEPVGPFGLDERFGNRKVFQEFVQYAHEHGIAVILDMIYGHSGAGFAYEYVYSNLNYHENPFMGAFAKDMFGPSTDYQREFTRDFYYTVNYYWLDRYHADGIRYDCVPNYYDGFMGKGYANLVYNTYQTVKETNGWGYWQRFFNGNKFNLIQCAEQLEAPVEIVEKTYSSCTWQNETLNAAENVAHEDFGFLYNLGMCFGLAGYPETEGKSAFQYIENHDHSRFICNFGTNDLYRGIFREGKRENWYRLQPFVIGLLLAKGVPMLWQGQEIVENYDVPDSGPARIGTLRPVRWERFYTPEGKAMIGLYRKLIALRNHEEIFRNGDYFFINDWNNYQSKGLLLFRRKWNDREVLVALNFSGSEHLAEVTFSNPGNYTELLHGHDDLPGVHEGQTIILRIPSYYGRVWMK